MEYQFLVESCLLQPASEGRGMVIISVCSHLWGRGYPVPGLDMGEVPHPRSGWGYLHPEIPPCPRLDGVPLPPSKTEWGTHPSAKGALATRRAVCLLRSRRRTFLLKFCSRFCARYECLHLNWVFHCK